MSVAASVVIPRDLVVIPSLRILGGLVTAGQTFSKGWNMARSAAGTLQVATEAPGLLPAGFADRQIVVADPGSADYVNTNCGVYSVDVSPTDMFSATDGPRPIYWVDNQLFARSATNPTTGAQRSIAGLFLGLDNSPLATSPSNLASANKVLAWIGPEGAAMAAALQQSQAVVARDRCRGMLTSLAASTTYAAGVMTGPANTALGTQDGIATLQVGDVEWAQKGLTNLPSANQVGPWQIASLGSASTPYVLVRPWWYPTGTAINLLNEIAIGVEGTGPLAPTKWRAFCAPTVLVDGGDPLFWPQFARIGATLSTGGITAAITSIPVRAWPGSRITFTPSTLASDGTVTLWRPTSVTAGAIGTATFTITGESVAGTAVAGARTVGQVEVQNY